MAGRYSNPVPQYQDDNTAAMAGGLVYFYVSGTTTPQATYSDEALTTLNANPVVLDAAGRLPNVFAAYDKVFRVVLKTSAGVTVWTRDDVQFADVSELVALAAALQAQIDNIETIVTNGNPIRNPTTELVTSDDSVTLTTAFLPHVCVGIDGRVSGTVTAGTMTSGSLAGLGTTARQAKMAGVSGDSSSIVEWRFRIGSREALRLSNKTVSISAALRQESGLTATTTIALYSANAVDNFSAVTLIGSVASSTTSGVNTSIEYAGLALTDVSNGLELVIKTQPGASFSTKDFYLTDIKIEVAATASTFVPPAFASLVSDALDIADMVFRDSGTANAAVVTTRMAVSLYEGLALTVYRPTGNSAAMTLNVDGTGAIGVTYADGTDVSSGDTLSGRNYTFRYSSATSKWILENPAYNDGNLAMVLTAAQTASGAQIDFTGIPAWAKRITVILSGVSTTAGNVTYLQIGDSGGIEATGYESAATAGASNTSITTAFIVVPNTTAAGTASGHCVLTKIDGNEWVCSATIIAYNGLDGSIATGRKTLSGTLDRLRLNNAAADTFDAGKFSIIYE